MNTKNWESDLNRKLLKRYSASLMNNTKWREVWTIIARCKVQLQLAFADDHEFPTDQLHGPFPSNWIDERGIRDPGIGGPFLFKEILWIRIPKMQRANLDELRVELNALGKLPLTETDLYYQITGYQS